MESDAWAPQVLTGLGIWGSTITDLLMIRMIRSSNLTLMYSIHRLYQTRQFLIWRRNTQIFISRQRIPLMKADLGMSKAKGEFFYTIFARWSNKTSCRPSKDPIPLLVDPHLNILSTANVPCQQRDWWRNFLHIWIGFLSNYRTHCSIVSYTTSLSV